MPVANSKRLDALNGVVSTLAGISVAGGYEFDLAGSVSSDVLSFDARRASGLPQVLTVFDGAEQFTPITTSGRLMRADLDVVVEVLIARTTSASMVEQLNDLLRDVHRCIDSNRTVGVNGVDVQVTGIDAPLYDSDDNTAFAVVRLRASYDYTAGASL